MWWHFMASRVPKMQSVGRFQCMHSSEVDLDVVGVKKNLPNTATRTQKRVTMTEISPPAKFQRKFR